jgi:OOP family OmpA-OmpF porin
MRDINERRNYFMRKLIAGLFMTLFLMTSGMAYAGERAGAFILSPFVGGYVFDGVEKLETRVTPGLRLGYDFTKNFALEGTFNYVNTEFSRFITNSVNVYNYRLEGVYNFMPENVVVPYLAIGGGGETIDLSNRNKTYPTANAGLGIKWFLTDDVALRADYHQNFIINNDSVLAEARQDYVMNYEYTLGLHILFGGEKPMPPSSSLSVMPGSVMKGESATLSWTSQNATGCTIQPGLGAVLPQGSMSVSPAMDTTYTLTCSGKAGTTSSMVNVAVKTPPPPPPPTPTSSISVTPPSIQQGESAILNWSSQNATSCDLQPGIGQVQPQGSMNITPAADTAYTLSCSGPGGSTSSAVNVAVVVPPPPPPEMLCYKIEIEFDTAKWNIKPRYHDELTKLADFMKQYPKLTGVIEGYTDSVGSDAYNLKLSDRRANSVRDYLVDKLGIDGSRLTGKGFGEANPVADNKTAEGRQKNRRVVANFECVEKKH